MLNLAQEPHIDIEQSLSIWTERRHWQQASAFDLNKQHHCTSMFHTIQSSLLHVLVQSHSQQLYVQQFRSPHKLNTLGCQPWTALIKKGVLQLSRLVIPFSYAQCIEPSCHFRTPRPISKPPSHHLSSPIQVVCSWVGKNCSGSNYWY